MGRWIIFGAPLHHQGLHLASTHRNCRKPEQIFAEIREAFNFIARHRQSTSYFTIFSAIAHARN